MKKLSIVIAAASLAGMMSVPGVAEGDANKGKRIWNRCKACHTLEAGKNRMGPSLAGVFGRTAGTLEGFKFSKAMKESGVVWSDETIAALLKSPRKYIKGTKMSFPGIRKDAQIADLLAYMHQELGE